MTASAPASAAVATTRLLLVRHGESMVTVRRIVGGSRSCTGLSPLGRQQAARLRDRLAAGHEPGVDVLVASPMPRAQETAEVLNEVLGLPLQLEVDVEEHRPGDADGLAWSEVEDRFGPHDGRRYPHRRLAPGAETAAEFDHRVAVVLDRLVAEHLGRTVLVACHGGVIAAAFRAALHVSPRLAPDLWTLNASITELVAAHPVGEHPERWRLVRYNDAAHLAGLPVATSVDDRSVP